MNIGIIGLGADNLALKVVKDITNALDFSSGKPALALGWNTSAGESVQSWIPNSHAVKVLNSINAPAMINPTTFICHVPDMFIASNDEAMKKHSRETQECRLGHC
jgi:8-hydroxy-5-deazaflavin:NADPH oxidoreductase